MIVKTVRSDLENVSCLIIQNLEGRDCIVNYLRSNIFCYFSAVNGTPNTFFIDHVNKAIH